MKARDFKDNEIPYFCWDRDLTVAQVRLTLQNASGQEWLRLASWIMREASVSDVWAFLTPQEVKKHLDDLTPLLHKQKEFWNYLIGTWHELGKL